jgi:hypothetical protein
MDSSPLNTFTLAGRLSVRREAGEHLFHRLLHADLTGAANRPAAAD